MKKHFRCIGCLIGLVPLLYLPAVRADEINWHGFASQGVIQAQDTNYVENNGDLSFKLTEVGLNASYRINSSLRIAGQAVYLNGGNRYPEGPRLDYLILDWQLVNNIDWQVNLHLGRYKNYHWLYSSTRDVPHTRPTIILPQSVYFDVFRDVALGTDGISMQAQTSNDLGDWELNWSMGSTPISNEQTENLLGQFSSGNLTLKFDHKATLFWQPKETNLRVGVSYLRAEFDYDQGMSDLYIDGDAVSRRIMGSVTYLSENWDLAIEVLRERVVYNDFIFQGFKIDATAEGGYLQGRYFVNRDITLTARLDLFDLDRTDRSGKRRQLQSGGVVPAYFGFQDQATVGASWDFAQNWRVQSEFHRVKGTGRLAPVLMPNTALNHSKYWNIWAIQFMYWF